MFGYAFRQCGQIGKILPVGASRSPNRETVTFSLFAATATTAARVHQARGPLVRAAIRTELSRPSRTGEYRWNRRPASSRPVVQLDRLSQLGLPASAPIACMGADPHECAPGHLKRPRRDLLMPSSSMIPPNPRERRFHCPKRAILTIHSLTWRDVAVLALVNSCDKTPAERGG